MQFPYPEQVLFTPQALVGVEEFEPDLDIAKAYL